VTGDHLDTAAGQVRTAAAVHRLALSLIYPSGRVYSTDCGRDLFAADGAMLTTDPVTCPACLGTAGR